MRSAGGRMGHLPSVCWTGMEPSFLLHADAHCVVVDKPAGLPAVPGRPQALHDCAYSRVQAAYPDARVVHRLDMATSGLLLFARGRDAQRALSRAFEQRGVRKRYVAVVHGEMRAPAGAIELPIGAHWPDRPRRHVDHARGQAALTRFRVLAVEAGRTRVELEPVTGRTHQLRVHLAAIGHPILGDSLYAPAAVQVAAPRLLLHASELAFPRPDTGEMFEVRSEADFGLPMIGPS
jgi:tRNA pseudouridine32 synthase/23S rRNA pseudouridine746 synthase